jgi:hypothetical protein
MLTFLPFSQTNPNQTLTADDATKGKYGGVTRSVVGRRPIRVGEVRLLSSSTTF